MFFYVEWKIRRSKAEESGNTAEGGRVTTGISAGVTGSGAGRPDQKETLGPAMRTTSTEVEATLRRARGSSCERE